jgi:mono/diheme cytochrome c family protein
VFEVVRLVSGWAVVCIGIAASIGVGMAGCHNVPALTQQEIAGKYLYLGRCAHCHEENDLALKKIPPDLHAVFKRTTLLSGAPATDAEVRRVVLAGKGMMPAFAGRFTDVQMDELVAYLHTGLR